MSARQAAQRAKSADSEGASVGAGPDRSVLETLVERYDPEVFQPSRSARVRLAVIDGETWDAVLERRRARLRQPYGDADAVLTADLATWKQIATDVRGGMQAFRRNRLAVRRNLHVGVGFLAATSGATEEGRLVFSTQKTAAGRLSLLEAGRGQPVVALHGLGASKASFLPTVTALADKFRVIAVDLPGFGDSDKPLRAAYDPAFFARAVVALLDSLGVEQAHLIGNSLGGRVALEVGFTEPERIGRLALLAPSLAWRRGRPWAPLLRLIRPELGAIQPAPRVLVDGIVDRMVPGASEGWTAAGVDEFMRSYLTARGRAAFYAAARQIYLEEPHGAAGFWSRLEHLELPSLFVWGRRDRLVPIGFARHVSEAVPHAEHLELDCGHVPQLERPRETHAAVASFLRGAPN